jgi:hypothetical protein
MKEHLTCTIDKDVFDALERYRGNTRMNGERMLSRSAAVEKILKKALKGV